MEKGIITHVTRGDAIHRDNRDAFWLQKPDATGAQYSSVCVCNYHPQAKVLPLHAHPHGEETGYVVSGSGKVMIGDNCYDIEPGSVFLFPQGVRHSIWNQSDETMQVVFFYAASQDATITVECEGEFPEE